MGVSTTYLEIKSLGEFLAYERWEAGSLETGPVVDTDDLDRWDAIEAEEEGWEALSRGDRPDAPPNPELADVDLDKDEGRILRSLRDGGAERAVDLLSDPPKALEGPEALELWGEEYLVPGVLCPSAIREAAADLPPPTTLTAEGVDARIVTRYAALRRFLKEAAGRKSTVLVFRS